MQFYAHQLEVYPSVSNWTYLYSQVNMQKALHNMWHNLAEICSHIHFRWTAFTCTSLCMLNFSDVHLKTFFICTPKKPSKKVFGNVSHTDILICIYTQLMCWLRFSVWYLVANSDLLLRSYMQQL